MIGHSRKRRNDDEYGPCKRIQTKINAQAPGHLGFKRHPDTHPESEPNHKRSRNDTGIKLLYPSRLMEFPPVPLYRSLNDTIENHVGQGQMVLYNRSGPTIAEIFDDDDAQ
jgi:hypothetical protein